MLVGFAHQAHARNSYYGLPLHLFREVYITFVNLRERIIKFMHFRRITRNMNERFPNVSAEELQEGGDSTCPICWEEMDTAKR